MCNSEDGLLVLGAWHSWVLLIKIVILTIMIIVSSLVLEVRPCHLGVYL